MSNPGPILAVGGNPCYFCPIKKDGVSQFIPEMPEDPSEMLEAMNRTLTYKRDRYHQCTL